MRTNGKEHEASIQGTVIRELIARFTSDHLIGKKIKTGASEKTGGAPWIPPQGFHVTEIAMENFTMEWLEWETINPKKCFSSSTAAAMWGKCATPTEILQRHTASWGMESAYSP